MFELLVNVPQVVLDGLGGHEQQLGDRFRGQALGRELADAQLTRSQ